jgi:uncharacterized protein YecE (DUF72 family)
MWGLKEWVGTLFPAGSKQRDFLALYSRRFTAVEGNTTFYGLPDRTTLERWRAETPVGFKFCLKFPQTISHHKRLREAQAETERFCDGLQLLGERCGPAFLQLPPSFSKRNLPALALYLAALPTDFRYAVEVRHLDFFTTPGEGELDAVLRQHRIARVLLDARGLRSAEPDDAVTSAAQERKPKVPPRFTRTAPFTLVRYIGHPEVMANAEWLTEWAERVTEWETAGDDVFFFLHSPDDAISPKLARVFHGLLSTQVSLPPLPDWEASPTLQQGQLF